MLPASKDHFPKCLYLDQNKWIDLARAHYGKPEGQHFHDALLAVRNSIESGKLIVPFSMVNAVEAMVPKDADRRERLARFMVELSGNFTVLPYMTVCSSEISNALARLFSKEPPTIIRPLVVQQGFANALGIHVMASGASPELQSAVQEIHSREASVTFLLAAAKKRDRIEKGREGEALMVGIFEHARSHAAVALSLEQRRCLEFKGLLSRNGLHGPDLMAGLQGLGLKIPDFKTRVCSDEYIVRFGTDIPCLDVYVTLTLARDRDLVRPIHCNDERDLGWLTVALPYVNVIVSENYWGHQVRATGLDEKYGTLLLTDLGELPESLQAMGCAA